MAASCSGQYPRSGYHITRIGSPVQFDKYRVALRNLLQLCVNPDPVNSSIGFRAPLADVEAESYWKSLSAKLDVTPITVHLFVLSATQSSADVLATVQIFTIPKITHRHRAEIAKLLVHPSARRKGIATILMDFVEEFARDELGTEMLTLDTASETPAMAFYERSGWKQWGTCPEYAEYADGRRCDATFFHKFIRRPSAPV
ncbi:hypothetical protein JX266_000579 [Neoarthrinium moseri]|nr:hypothetical protein JX266_000579 [Neoarthrinium moseri]